jgi:hypothetical protein
MDDPAFALRIVDFLMKTHLFGKEAPHPFPPNFTVSFISFD